VKNQLHPGQTAPPFRGATYEGGTITLEDFRGGKVWLGFYRYASCPLCNFRIHHITQRHAEYDSAGLTVIAVFQSSAESMAKYVAGQEPPFVLVSDPEEATYAQFGVRSSKLGFLAPTNVAGLARAASVGFLPGRMEGTIDRVPADFLIDEAGVIQDVFYGKTIADHIGFDRVDAFLAND
jgi:peroxiredoxin Q/BCP